MFECNEYKYEWNLYVKWDFCRLASSLTLEYSVNNVVFIANNEANASVIN